MDARFLRFALVIVVGLVALAPLSAAEYRTDNFVVTAPSRDFAKKVAMTAERWRVRLAKQWLGHDIPNWSRPCPIQVQVGQIGAGGETTFRFAPNPKTGRNEVYGWEMRVQGTAQRILDSVIPHEVSHTIFASHFRRPLPRWADEGAATLAEHESERRRQDLTLKQVWDDGRFPLKQLLSMKEYPRDMQDVMTLYAQGYSLASYLVQKGGRERFLKLLAMAKKKSWPVAFEALYGIDDIRTLESVWGSWVIAGSPDLEPGIMLASSETPTPGTGDSERQTVRGQSPPSSQESRSNVPAQVSAGRDAAPAKVTFGGFLPPTAPKSTASDSVVLTDTSDSTREPRPRPLGLSMKNFEPPQDLAAIETSHHRSGQNRAAFPRQARVSPSDIQQDRDYFSSSQTRADGAGHGSLEGIGFPAPRTNAQ